MGKSIACRKCKSDNTSETYKVVDSPYGYLEVQCNDCGYITVMDCIVPEDNDELG